MTPGGGWQMQCLILLSVTACQSNSAPGPVKGAYAEMPTNCSFLVNIFWMAELSMGGALPPPSSASAPSTHASQEPREEVKD